MAYSIKIPIIKETIKEFCQRYRDKLEVYPNNLAANFMKAGGIVRKEDEIYKSIKLISHS